MQVDKPYKSYSQQIALLRERGMSIESDRLATIILKAYGYYNLVNGYKDDFLLPKKSKSEEDKFKQGTQLTDLVFQQRIENDLRNILFKYTLLVESRFKESLAHIISTKYGERIEDYLNYKNYRNWNKSSRICTKLINRSTSTFDNPTKFYRDHHTHIPAWILFDNLTYGETRMFFSIQPRDTTEYVVNQLLPIETELQEFIPDNIDFPNSDNRKMTDTELDEWFHNAIDKQMVATIELIRNMISLINDFRNNMAHGSRLKHFQGRQPINIKILHQFTRRKIVSKSEYDAGMGKKDLFAFMISISTLLDPYNASALAFELKRWRTDNMKMSDSIPGFKTYFKSLGLPHDFDKRLNGILSRNIIRKNSRRGI